MQIEIRDFLSYITVKKGLADNSVKCCRIRISLFSDWLNDKKKEISKQSVEEYFYHLKEERRLKNNSLNTYLFTLRMYRDYCLDRNYPADFLDGFASFKKEKPVITILTPSEVEKLINTEVK